MFLSHISNSCIIRNKLLHPDDILSTQIHADVVGSRVDVVMLHDHMMSVARFSYGVFTVMVRNENQAVYM